MADSSDTKICTRSKGKEIGKEREKGMGKEKGKKEVEMVDIEMKEKRHEFEKGKYEGETEERPNATLISSIIKDIFSDPHFKVFTRNQS